MTTVQQPEKKALYMMTLGCPKNRVDSEVMLGTLTQRGYSLVPEPSQAELVTEGIKGLLRTPVELAGRALGAVQHRRSHRRSRARVPERVRRSGRERVDGVVGRERRDHGVRVTADQDRRSQADRCRRVTRRRLEDQVGRPEQW